MRILLTGANGMVGRNFLEHPANRDNTVLKPSRQELDLNVKADVAAAIESFRPDVVVHCAGRVGGIQANVAHPTAFLTENLVSGLNVVNEAYRLGVPKFLNLGSSCMYPKDRMTPLREEEVLDGKLEPTNEGYAIAKIAIARLCSYVRMEEPSRAFKSLIPCNLYGRHDKFDPKHSHLIPAIIHKVHTAKTKSERQVEIWGDGSARREFMDAADLAEMMHLALSRMDELPDLLNVGLGFDYSVKEYYEAAADVIGYNGEFTYDTSKPVGMKRKLLSTDRMHALGWKAKTDLRTGIRKAYDFYLERNG